MYAGEVVEQRRRARPVHASALPVHRGPARRRTRAWLAESSRLPTLPGRVPPPGSWPTGCRFAGRARSRGPVHCEAPSPSWPSSGQSVTRCIRIDELSAKERCRDEHHGLHRITADDTTMPVLTGRRPSGRVPPPPRREHVQGTGRRQPHRAPGRTIGLVGESGSGKSTLANAVLGLVPVQSGTVQLPRPGHHHACPGTTRGHSADLQAVFQDPNSSLNPSWTVGRSLAEPMRAQGARSASEIRTRAAQMLERRRPEPPMRPTGYPAQFSGGQRQRICIAGRS